MRASSPVEGRSEDRKRNRRIRGISRIAQLARETRRLERKLEASRNGDRHPKKVAALLGIPLKSPDDEEND